MRKRAIGNTGIRVSALCLGTMTFGTPVAEPEAERIIHRALDAGVNFIDTANMYEGYARVAGSAGGVAEVILGRALKGRRVECVLATKLGMKVGDAPEDEFASPAAIEKQLDASLKRLRTNCIDLYYVHKYDPHTPPEEIARAMSKQVRAGKIRAWGVSNYSAEQLSALLAACAGEIPPCAVQPPLSLLKQDALDDLLPLCAREGLSAIAYQVFQGGLLTGKYRRGEAPPTGSRAQEKPDWLAPDDATLARVEGFTEQARSEGLTLPIYALKWALAQPAVASAIVGVKSEAQLDMLLEGMI